MSVIRVGSNGSYAEGWDEVFGKGKGKAKAAGKKTAKKAAKKVVKSKDVKSKVAKKKR